MDVTFTPTPTRCALAGPPADGTSPPRVVEVSGEVDLASCRDAPAVLRELTAGAPLPVVLDLSGVTFLDAAGLSVLLVLAARTSAAGRPVSVRRPSPAVVRLLALTGTADLLPLGPARGDTGAVSDERLSLERSQVFRHVEHLVHDGTSWDDPCAGPASSRDTAERPALAPAVS